MKNIILRIVIILSFILNLIFITLFILAALSKSSLISFYDMHATGNPVITAASIVSVPLGGEVIFTPVDITMRIGEKAHLQFSVFFDGRQSSRFTEPLYDRSILSIKQTGLGIVINALRAGESTLQAVTEDGVITIATVNVSDVLE